MSKKKLFYRVSSVVLAFMMLASMLVIPTVANADDGVITTMTETVVNGGMEDGSWYAWAGENVVYEYEKDGQTITLTGNSINEGVWSEWSPHSGSKHMCFGGWGPSDSFPVIPGDTFKQELAPGCKSYIDEAKFANMNLSDMTLSVWVYNLQNGEAVGPIHTFDVKYRAVNEDGSFGEYHTASFAEQLQGQHWGWTNVTAKLDDMTAECANAKTIELEISAVSSYSALFIDDVDVIAPAIEPIEIPDPVPGDTIDNTVINGDMEDNSWYAWAGEQVLLKAGEYYYIENGNRIEGTEDLTGNAINGIVHTDWNAHGGSKNMVLPSWTKAYPVINGDYNESETIPGCKSTLYEDKFVKMDPSNMTFSAWVYIYHGDVSGQFFIFDVNYRVVYKDGSYGPTHTLSLRNQVTEGNKWLKVSGLLDDLSSEVANAATLELEFFSKSYCGLFIDDVDVTAPMVDNTIVKGSLVNGNMENGSWYKWAGDEKLYGDITGNALDGEVSTSEVKHSGNKGMQFVRDWGSYPAKGAYGESEMIDGCKTTINKYKFAQMDLSDMTFSIWAKVDSDQFFAFDVKYRAVFADGTYGEYHTETLLAPVLANIGNWANSTVKLDDMSSECIGAETIEFELFTRSYTTVYIDDADVIAPVVDNTIVKGSLVNGDMEDGSWYKWAGDEKLYEDLTGNALDGEVSTSDVKHSGNKGMQFVRDWGSYPAKGAYGESEMIDGCKTTIDKNKFAQMDLSDMTFSIWAKVDSDQFFAFDVKYRAVFADGTHGEYHTETLLAPVLANIGNWTESTIKLDDMTSECVGAETIEFELFTKSYTTVYIDDADVVASKLVETEEDIVGDIDGDGLVQATDLTLMRSCFFNASLAEEYDCDVDGDGDFDIIDIIKIKKMLIEA